MLRGLAKTIPLDRFHRRSSGRIDGCRVSGVVLVVLSTAARDGHLQYRHGMAATSARWSCFFGRTADAATASAYIGRSARLPIASHVVAYSNDIEDCFDTVNLDEQHPMDFDLWI